MRILSYLLIAVFLLSGCSSLFGEDEFPKFTPEQVGQIIRWAEEGDAEAQSTLGLMYHYGKGVNQDHQLAVKWYRRAAEQGFAEAQYSLGTMYYLGKGVPKDFVLAYKWYNLAAAQGNKNATKLRDDIATKMIPSQIAEAQKLARIFKPKEEQNPHSTRGKEDLEVIPLINPKENPKK